MREPAVRTSRGLFVTGTDTGVGKTRVACMLLRAFAARGERVVGMKPVATGAQWTGAGLRNEDVAQLCAASNAAAPLELVNPYCFAPAIAPHLAAAEAGARIELGRIVDACSKLAALADRVVVEGVGGFAVPLGEDYGTADLARMLGLPVVLVVGMRLGCLNHALLTVQAVERCGLRLAGWVANCIDPEMQRLEGNVETLRTRLSAPLLGLVPHDPVPGEAAMPGLAIERLSA
jgi:dethiobiotin synthetase